MKKSFNIKSLLALLLALLLLLPGASLAKSKKKKNTPTPVPVVTATVAPTAAPTGTPLPEGAITDRQSIADYLFANGCLPENFITKNEAKALGWSGSGGDDLWRYAPGMSIGGDHFGNYEGILPQTDEKGRRISYRECDMDYHGGRRDANRVVFSSNGHVYYTVDHYNSFTELFPTVPELRVYYEFKMK